MQICQWRVLKRKRKKALGKGRWVCVEACKIEHSMAKQSLNENTPFGKWMPTSQVANVNSLSVSPLGAYEGSCRNLWQIENCSWKAAGLWDSFIVKIRNSLCEVGCIGLWRIIGWLHKWENTWTYLLVVLGKAQTQLLGVFCCRFRCDSLV